MLRKFVSLALIFAMLLGITLIPNSNTRVSEDTKEQVVDVTLKENNTQVSSETEVEGTVVKCTYDKQEETYSLHLDEAKYYLNVDMYDGCAMVYMASSNDTIYDEQVVAQSVAAIAFSAGYWAPAIVAAAKVVISSVVAATLAVATYYSAELIATTIKGVKSRVITKSDLHTKARTVTRALDVVQKAKKSNAAYYYSAFIYKGMIMLEKQLTFTQAVSRLKRGYDVFASNYNASWLAAAAAGKNGKAYPDDPHEICLGDTFPHFHPVGRKWVLNPTHQPHCWFPL